MRFFRLNRFALLAIQSTSPCRRSRYTPVGMGARSAGEFSARSLAWPSMSSCHIPAPGASFACIGVAVPVKPPLAKDSFARQKRREALLKSDLGESTGQVVLIALIFLFWKFLRIIVGRVWKGGR